MKKLVMFTAMMLLVCPLLAQQGRGKKNMEEVRETLRLYRMLEIKKQLNLPEEKLIALNEVLDVYEETKFTNQRQVRQLAMQMRSEVSSDARATELLDQLAAIRKERLESEVTLLAKVRELLSPSEALSFMKFYEKFSRDVKRRIRGWQQDGRGKRKGMGPGRN